MATTPYSELPKAVVDGMLVEIGERLFRSRRGAQDDGSGRPGGGRANRPPMTPAEVRAAVRDFVRPGGQQVMVKVTGGGRGIRAMAAHLRYISRQGQEEVGGKGRTLEVIDERGERHQGREAMQELIADWRTAGSYIPEVSHRREAFHIIFSMPAGTRSDALLSSVQATAHKLYDGHRYVMAMHTDQGAPHVHVMVRAEGKGAKRLNPRKADLDHWRATFARELQARGVDAVASRQATRFAVRSYPALWEIRAAEEGRLQRQRSGRKTGEKMNQARMTAAKTWGEMVNALARSPEITDMRLAAEIVGVFQRMTASTRQRDPEVERKGQGIRDSLDRTRGEIDRSGRGIVREQSLERDRDRGRRGPER